MAKSKGKILVVDDNSGIRAALKLLLPLHFSQVELIPSPKELVSRLAEFRPDVVLLDMNFHTDINTGNEGLYWLSEIKKRCPDIEVVLFTAYADIALAVEGMKRGAFDFIVKPWDNDKLVETLKGAYSNISKEVKNASSVTPSGTTILWGKGPAMSVIRKTAEKIAPTDATVLITGENGTGKDVLAGEIHRLSERALRPMVCVDAGALTETLFESELFGHVKGAFTDAHTDHVGKFEQGIVVITVSIDGQSNGPCSIALELLDTLYGHGRHSTGIYGDTHDEQFIFGDDDFGSICIVGDIVDGYFIGKSLSHVLHDLSGSVGGTEIYGSCFHLYKDYQRMETKVIIFTET